MIPVLFSASATLASIHLLSLIGILANGQDTVTVQANNPPTWGTDLRLVEELRLGCLNGPEECSFGNVTGIAVTPDGTVFVADRIGPTIRRFDKAGTYRGTVGRPGSGPGEYRRIGGMTALADGGIAVWDHPNQRITLFDSTGGFAGSFRATNSTPSADLRADSAGFLYLSAPATNERGRLGVESAKVWVRLTLRGEVDDSIPVPMRDIVGPNFWWSSPAGPRWPFSIATESALSPHGYLVVGRNSEYSLHRPLPDGRILRIERDYEAVDVLPGEREEWGAIHETLSGLLPGAENGLPIPRSKPPFGSLWVDSEGRIWVSLYVKAKRVTLPPDLEAEGRIIPRHTWIEPTTYDLIDPRGSLLATLTVPPRSQVEAAFGRQMWVIQQGDFGEEYVVRYRVVQE